MNSGSLIVTAGISNDKRYLLNYFFFPNFYRNLCIWDTLLPPSKMLVKSFSNHEMGATSVVYSPRHQLLISGGKKGDIGKLIILYARISNIFLVVIDVRQQKLLETIKGHTLNVKSLALDSLEDFFLSGSSEGNIKSWSLPSLECKENWDDVHMKHRFVRTGAVFASTVR